MIVDIHSQLGSHPLFRFEQTLEEIIVDIENYGIDKTFLHSVPSMCHFQESNNVIAKAVEQYPNKLIGFFNVNPMDPKASKEIDRAVSLELKGLMLDPEFHYSMEQPITPGDKYLPPLMERAEEYNLPVLIVIPNIRSGMSPNSVMAMYRGLDELLARFPEVRVIVDLFTPGIIELCKKHSNIYVDTAGASGGRITRLIYQLSATRLLFGSYSPRYHSGIHMKTIKWLDLSIEQKSMILGGNAERIFKDIL